MPKYIHDDDDNNTTYKEGFRYLVRRYGQVVEVLVATVTISAYKLKFAGALISEWREQAEFESETIVIECLGMDQSFLPKGFPELYRYVESLHSDEAAMPDNLAEIMKQCSIYFPTLTTATP
jgi:hypothetical protein